MKDWLFISGDIKLEEIDNDVLLIAHLEWKRKTAIDVLKCSFVLDVKIAFNSVSEALGWLISVCSEKDLS